jgi:hypothetical protein
MMPIVKFSFFDKRSLNVLPFGSFPGIFLFDFAQNPVRNYWIHIFEWLIMYNMSSPSVFQHTESIYAFKNAI